MNITIIIIHQLIQFEQFQQKATDAKNIQICYPTRQQSHLKLTNKLKYEH